MDRRLLLIHLILQAVPTALIISDTRKLLMYPMRVLYAQWKNFLGFINNYEKKNTIEAITVSYNESTDAVTGTMTLALYSVSGDGRNFEEPKFDLKTGTDNIFAKPGE